MSRTYRNNDDRDFLFKSVFSKKFVDRYRHAHAATRYNELKGCKQKKYYEGINEAIREGIRLLQHTPNKEIAYYNCKFCHGYHLTTKLEYNVNIIVPKKVKTVKRHRYIEEENYV